MAKGFSIMDMMNEISREEAAEEAVVEKVSVFDIQPNDDNFYKISGIEQLKNSIYAMGGVQQNLLLAKLPLGSKFKYKMLAGHRRIRACIELVQEGHKEFEYVPAIIRENIDKNTENALLIMTNSTQRELTDWEKVMQHMKLKEIIPKLKKQQGIDGKTRTLEADYLGISEGQIAIYNAVGTKLHAELMNLLERGCIGISLAYEVAKLEPELQEQLAEIAHNKGSIYEEDIKQLLGSRPMKDQLKMSEETVDTEKVTESDTFEKTQKEPVHIAAVKKKEICYTTSEDDVDSAIYYIFRLDDFPEDKLQKLIEAYRQDQNHIAVENAFYEMLPYENSVIKVFYQMGYQVEYIHTGETVKIPVYYFWKGFEREFKKRLKEEAELTDVVEIIEKVTESDTFEKTQNESVHVPATDQKEEPDQADIAESMEIVAESDNADESMAAVDENDEKQEENFRGGYEPILIKDLIHKYDSYLGMARDENINNLVCEYSCLLDALELLEKRINKQL